MDARIGETAPDLIAGRYLCQEPIGAGGTADVYRAIDRATHQPVALKLLRPALAADPGWVARFEAGARAGAGLRHPHIVPILDWGADQGRRFVVEALVAGPDLKRVLRAQGALPVTTALRLARGVAQALGAAHAASVLHRDVKPHNILLTADGSPRLTDFGIARAAGTAGLTQGTAVLGSVQYVSPEQAQGKPLDARSDLYSLGVVLYELLTGRLPFESESVAAVAYQHVHAPPPSPRRFRPGLAPVVEGIVLRLLAKSPTDRFSDAGSLVAALDGAILHLAPRSARRADVAATDRLPLAHAVSGRPVRAGTGRLGPLGRPGRRQALALATVIGLVMFVGAAAYTANPAAGLAGPGLTADLASVPQPVTPASADQATPVPPVATIAPATPTAALATVPEVVGLPEADARERLAAAGLAVSRIDAEPGDGVAPGSVSAQSLEPGQTVPAGSSLALAISTGPARVAVPPAAPATAPAEVPAPPPTLPASLPPPVSVPPAAVPVAAPGGHFKPPSSPKPGAGPGRGNEGNHGGGKKGR